ncbi:MAG: hypothetical protein LWW74_01350 [Burkholderiales bacterium]|nr:hypothetical protein [Burkholderiales bacterium]MCE1177214.1 hypothetical protein [Burkholderiales bacterium]
MYEHKKQAVISRQQFRQRIQKHLFAVLLLLLLSLAVGMLGYHRFEQLSWMDAFLNSAMLLGGMGPVNTPVTSAGKLFAGLYALYAGLVFIVTAALIFSPIAHRILHTFHWDEND